MYIAIIQTNNDIITSDYIYRSFDDAANYLSHFCGMSFNIFQLKQLQNTGILIFPSITMYIRKMNIKNSTFNEVPNTNDVFHQMSQCHHC